MIWNFLLIVYVIIVSYCFSSAAHDVFAIVFQVLRWVHDQNSQPWCARSTRWMSTLMISCRRNISADSNPTTTQSGGRKCRSKAVHRGYSCMSKLMLQGDTQCHNRHQALCNSTVPRIQIRPVAAPPYMNKVLSSPCLLLVLIGLQELITSIGGLARIA